MSDDYMNRSPNANLQRTGASGASLGQELHSLRDRSRGLGVAEGIHSAFGPVHNLMDEVEALIMSLIGDDRDVNMGQRVQITQSASATLPGLELDAQSMARRAVEVTQRVAELRSRIYG